MRPMAIMLGFALMASAATAQTGSSHNPALKNSSPATTTAPANGANSFTEAQARGRLKKAGYSSVGQLAKDNQGVWRGTAMKGGKKTKVGVDYKGNVVLK